MQLSDKAIKHALQYGIDFIDWMNKEGENVMNNGHFILRSDYPMGDDRNIVNTLWMYYRRNVRDNR